MEDLDVAIVGMASRLPQDVFEFDGAFFGCSDDEAAELDPQHRLFLECAYHAMENAGRVVDRSDGIAGVYGSANLSWYLLEHRRDSLAALLGNMPDGLAGRVAYELDLTGPCVTVQAACASSLVAVHLACQDLLNYQCDLALAGGVSIAAGGAGAGVVVLKRLADVRDDHVHAIIRGSAVANDGRRRAGSAAFSSAGARDAELGALAASGLETELVEHQAPRRENLAQASGVLALIDAVHSAPSAMDGVRRASVAASGSGGAHACVIVEPVEPRKSSDDSGWQLVPLSAKTPDALDTVVADLREHLIVHRPRIADVAHTLQVGRKPLPYRTFAVCRDDEFVVGPVQEPDFSSVAFSFTGSSIEEDMQTAQRLRDAGVEPVAVVGTGLGEYSAACVAGVLTLDEVLAMVTSRDCPDRLAKAVANAQPRTGDLPLLSGSTGAVVTGDELGDHQHWLSMGESSPAVPSLAAFVVQVSDVVDERTFLTAVGSVWARGTDVSWASLTDDEARRIPLPGYPFERRRYDLADQART